MRQTGLSPYCPKRLSACHQLWQGKAAGILTPGGGGRQGSSGYSAELHRCLMAGRRRKNSPSLLLLGRKADSSILYGRRKKSLVCLSLREGRRRKEEAPARMPGLTLLSAAPHLSPLYMLSISLLPILLSACLVFPTPTYLSSLPYTTPLPYFCSLACFSTACLAWAGRQAGRLAFFFFFLVGG